MRSTWLKFTCLLAAIAACAAVVARDDPAPTEADEKAIQTAVENLAAAFNKRDAKAATALFTPTGEFVDGDGNTFHGRAAIEAELTAVFAAHPHGQVTFETEHVRFLSAGLFMEEGTVTVSSAANPSMPGKKIGYLMVHAQQKDGAWLLASVRSKGDEDDATPQEQLQDLAWMVGDWVDESTESLVKTSVNWSDDRNFLISNFEIHVAGKPTMKGSHRIGWDPEAGRFKSWVFDSRGGHAEGYWTQIDDAWVVKLRGVSADGETGSMTSIYQPVGPDAYVFSTIDRVVGNEMLPGVSVRVVRKPPEPSKATK